MATNAEVPFELRRTGTEGRTAAPGRPNGQEPSLVESEHEFWQERSRLVITPTSAPSVLGLFGLSAATLIVAGNMAGWYGNSHSFVYYAPFALFFGGVAQFLAGMWSYKARDTLATAFHTMWGSFWLAWGTLYLLDGSKALAMPSAASHYFPAMGMWFVMLSLLTGIAAMVALFKDLSIFSVLGLLAGGAALVAAAFLSGNHGTLVAGGWVLVASAGAAAYAAAAILCADTFGRTILPMGKWNKSSNVPGRKVNLPIEYPFGMPGSRVGQ